MANYSEQNTPLKFFKLIKQKIHNLKSRNYKTKTFREVSRRMKPNQPLIEAKAGLWFSVLQRQKPNPGPILGSKSDRSEKLGLYIAFHVPSTICRISATWAMQENCLSYRGQERHKLLIRSLAGKTNTIYRNWRNKKMLRSK